MNTHLKNNWAALVFYVFLLSNLLLGQVVINEYSASNLTGYVDNYSMEEDWIELQLQQKSGSFWFPME